MDQSKELENNKKSITPRLILALATVASTSLCYSLQTSWSAVLPKIEEDTTNFTVTKEDVSWLVSLVSIVSIFAALFTGLLMEMLGPKRLMLFSIFPMAGLWLMMAFTPYLVLLYVGRAGLAICCSFVSTSVQPLVAELCPSNIRGLVSALSEIMTATGVLLGYLLAHFLPWHLTTAVSAIPCVSLFLIFLLSVPESPYWLVRHNKKDEAEQSLQRMLGPGSQVTDKLNAITTASPNTEASFKYQIHQLYKRQNAYPVALLWLIFLLREFGGKNMLLSYSVYAFRQAEVELDPFICTILLGGIRVIGHIVLAFSMDRLGRKPCLIASCFLCGVSLGVPGIFYVLELPGKSWVCLVFLLLFIFSFGLGVGPMPWVYLGELIPTPVRPFGASFIILTLNIASFVTNYAFFKIIEQMNFGVILLIFSLPNFFMLVIITFWLPETRGCSLEEVQDIFFKKIR